MRPAVPLAILVVLALVVRFSPASAYITVNRDYDNTNIYLGSTLNVPTPKVAKIVPSDGPASGRARVTVWGSDFKYTNFIKCRFSEQPSYKGTYWDVPATFVSEAMVICTTPDFVYSTKKTTGDCVYDTAQGHGEFTGPLAGSTKYCNHIYVTVTNDGMTYSGYISSGSGSYVKYRIWGGSPVGNVSLLDKAGTTSSVNATVPSYGVTTWTLKFSRASLEHCPIRDASHVKCFFTAASKTSLSPVADSSVMTPARWLKDVDDLNSIWTCDVADTNHAALLRVHLGYDIDVNTHRFTTADATYAVTQDKPTNIKIATRDDLVTNTTSNIGNPIMHLQRAPMWGNTEITIRGSFMYPSNRAYAVFISEYTTDGTNGFPAVPCDTPNGWVACLTNKCCYYSWASYSEPSNPPHALDPASNNVGYYRAMTPRHKDTWGYDHFEPSVLVEVGLALVDTQHTGSPLTCTAPCTTANGLPYSDAGNVFGKLRISDIYVDISGSDYDLDTNLTNGGDGSPHKPYRTIQRALDRAMINCRSPADCANGPYGLMHGQPAAKGSLQQFNRDLIILRGGFFNGPGNTGLKTRGKLVWLRSLSRHLEMSGAGSNGLQTVVDCANNGLGFIDESGQRYWDNDDNTEREAIYVQGIVQKNCSNKRSYSVYDYATKSYTTHTHPMTAYFKNDPKKPVFPYAARYRPGYKGN